MRRLEVGGIGCALSRGGTQGGGGRARATPAADGAGAALAPAPPRVEETGPIELPEVQWSNDPAGRAIHDIEGDKGCIWSAERGFDPLQLGVNPKYPPGDYAWLERLCTVTWMTNPRRQGFTLASKTEESWVPTPAKPSAYAYGAQGMFFTYRDPAHSVPDPVVMVERREQKTGETSWSHELGDVDDLVLTLTDGVLVVQWDEYTSTRRRMFDARTGEVLADETLPEAVWRVAHEGLTGVGYIDAFGQAHAEGRATAGALITLGKREEQAPLIEALIARGLHPRAGKNPIREFAYTDLDDGTTLTFETRGHDGTLRWLSRDTRRPLGTWRIPLHGMPLDQPWR